MYIYYSSCLPIFLSSTYILILKGQNHQKCGPDWHTDEAMMKHLSCHKVHRLHGGLTSHMCHAFPWCKCCGNLGDFRLASRARPRQSVNRKSAIKHNSRRFGGLQSNWTFISCELTFRNHTAAMEEEKNVQLLEVLTKLSTDTNYSVSDFGGFSMYLVSLVKKSENVFSV